jgi:hypothetical protein
MAKAAGLYVLAGLETAARWIMFRDRLAEARLVAGKWAAGGCLMATISCTEQLAPPERAPSKGRLSDQFNLPARSVI